MTKIYVGIYSHRHGIDTEIHNTIDDANAAQAGIAREWWDDRVDQSAPDDHSDLSDWEVIDAYFTENERETFEVHERKLPASILSSFSTDELLSELAKRNS